MTNALKHFNSFILENVIYETELTNV